MTKKDYELIAQLVRRARERNPTPAAQVALDEFVEFFIDEESCRNQSFQTARFRLETMRTA